MEKDSENSPCGSNIEFNGPETPYGTRNSPARVKWDLDLPPVTDSVGDLIIETGAEKTGEGEGMATSKSGMMHSSVTNQAIFDKGIKIKIRKTKLHNKYEIVKTGENDEKSLGSSEHKRDKKHGGKAASKDLKGVRFERTVVPVTPPAQIKEKRCDDAPLDLKKLKPHCSTKSSCVASSSSGPPYFPASPPLTPQVSQPPNSTSVAKELVDVCVGTSVATVTEPNCFVPCKSGTSVILEGIVWHETEGLLVLNVKWRGKNFVGTLHDNTKHNSALPRFRMYPTSDLDRRTPKGRGKRERSAANALLTDLTNFTETQSSVYSKLPSSNAVGQKGQRGPASSTLFATPKNEPSTSKREKKVQEEEPATKRKSIPSQFSSPPPPPVLFECPERNCSKKYKHLRSLQYHQSIEHGSLPPVLYECAEQNCSKRYLRKKNLEYHLSHDHGSLPPVLFECPERNCSKIYLHKRNLNYHLSHAHGSLDDQQKEIKIGKPKSKRCQFPQLPICRIYNPYNSQPPNLVPSVLEKASEPKQLTTSALHIRNTTKLKTAESPMEKHKNDNHQIIKESIEMKSQLNNSFIYQRQQQAPEDIRRFYMYPDRKEGPSTKATPPPPPPLKSHPIPSPKQKDKPDEKKERQDEKKQEGVKPTMETQGPPPPPTSQYAYIHPGYMQSPHYGTLPFDPSHPKYRGGNPMLVSGNPNYLNSQIHAVPRYAPEDLSRGQSGKTLDLLKHQDYCHPTHKIQELQERAIKSPIPKVSTSSSANSTAVVPVTASISVPGPASVLSLQNKDSQSPPP